MLRSLIALALALTAALPAMAQEGFTLSTLSEDFWSDGEVNEVAPRGRVQTDRQLKMIGGWPCTLDSPAEGNLGRYVEVKIGPNVFALVKYDQPITDYNAAGRAVLVTYTAGYQTPAGWQWSAMDDTFTAVNAGLSVPEGDGEEDLAPAGCTPFWEE